MGFLLHTNVGLDSSQYDVVSFSIGRKHLLHLLCHHSKLCLRNCSHVCIFKLRLQLRDGMAKTLWVLLSYDHWNVQALCHLSKTKRPRDNRTEVMDHRLEPFLDIATCNASEGIRNSCVQHDAASGEVVSRGAGGQTRHDQRGRTHQMKSIQRLGLSLPSLDMTKRGEQSEVHRQATTLYG